MTSTRREIIQEGINNCATASNMAVKLKTHPDPAVAELAKAIHFLAFGAQQIGLGLTDQGRIADLPQLSR
ncbi:hypothetical protein QE428_002583 [Microbacterium sp. SORGH_AS 505]|uniref:hypothetical protein n=1 Tax=Microbacterium sp. SORGH_AS_0505 TaxID=3041770 RepID=UPI00278042AE|nr:hypothetical protein [Microbacterium sp. SORGH_AS_0505]MDQ1127550.1 hypothetical protein [Microbacterium sp. SORGH_AS_0505]